MQDIIHKVQVNIPFRMLYDTYLDRFLEYALNPEIGIDAAILESKDMALVDDSDRGLGRRSIGDIKVR